MSRKAKRTAVACLASMTFANRDTTSVYAAQVYAASETDGTDSVTPSGTATAVTESNDSGMPTPASVPDGKPTNDRISLDATGYQELVDLGVAPSEASEFQTTFDETSPVADPSGPPIVSPPTNGGPRETLPPTWHMENKFLASVASHDGSTFDYDEPSGLKFGDKYSSGNTIYEESPSATNDEGTCKEVEAGVDTEGVSISEKSEQCSNTWGPSDLNGSTFTAKWDGEGHGVSPGTYRDTHGVSSWYSPGSAYPSRSLVWQYWWVTGGHIL